MNTLETLIRAIEKRKPIRFEYNKVGKIEGSRTGNPHAIFIFTTKTSKIQSTKVHIVQTGGVSDTNAKNEFRTFDIKEISNIQCMEEEDSFQPDERYNPNWDGYANVIAKI
jgi:predicted DNA-binding transcriptional regulator YafY